MLWVAQAMTIMGFTVTFPFFPIFFQELGVEDPGRVVFLTGVAGAVLGLGLALSSPIWGVLGDRYGRKLNIVRSIGLSAVLLLLTGFCQNVPQLLIARFLAGAVAGTQGPIVALIASTTPTRRAAFAMGVIQSAMLIGTSIGPVVGGPIFDTFGHQAAFVTTASFLAFATLLVMVGVKEDFDRPASGAISIARLFAGLWETAKARSMWPLFIVVFLLWFAQFAVYPVLTVLVQHLHGLDRAATVAGLVFMSLGISSAVSAVVTGWLSSRYGVRRVLWLACLGAAIVFSGPTFAESIPALAVTIFIVGLFQGGLVGSVNAMIARAAPVARQGSVFGVAQSVTALGFTIGPLLGGVVGDLLGLRSVFIMNAVLYAITATAVFLVLKPRSNDLENSG